MPHLSLLPSTSTSPPTSTSTHPATIPESPPTLSPASSSAHNPSSSSPNLLSSEPPTTAFKRRPSMASIPPSAFPESRVLIIATGGTICMKEGPEGLVPARGFLEEAMRPRPSFNDGCVCDDLPVVIADGSTVMLPSLRTPPSKYSKHTRYTLYEFETLLDSSSISSSGWSAIARAVEANYQLYDSFLILHGTDSLSYTASALSFMISHLGKTLLLTGSQSPIFSLHSDATDNLLGSLIIAGTFLIPEVTIYFSGTLLRGNRSTKVSASEFRAFETPNFEPLARATAAGIAVNWSAVRRPTSIGKFSVQHSLDSAHVACLRVFPGITPAMVDGVLRVPGLRGLILETFGAGNAPSDAALTSVIRDAIKRGIVIVNVSQCPSGTVSPLYAPANVLGSAGVVFGHDLTTEAALTKLFFLLARPELRYAEIVNLMAEDLRGEMTALPSSIQFCPAPTAEAGASLSSTQKNFTELAYAISAGDVDLVRSILDADTENLLFEVDYAGNSALHLAAVGGGVGHLQLVRLLLGKGAGVHVRNFANNTPLWLAQKMGRREIEKVLLQAGALLGVDEAKAA